MADEKPPTLRGLTIPEGMPPETIKIVEREMALLTADVFHAIHAAGGPLSDVVGDPAVLGDRMDKVVLRLAERVCARPRPPALDHCLLFVAVLAPFGCETARDRATPGFVPAPAVALIPALVHTDHSAEGFQALLRDAEQVGKLLATLTVFSEVQAATPPQRVAFADRSDGRGVLRLWSKGPIKPDGGAVLGPWTDDPPEGIGGKVPARVEMLN